jgi:hypothetical protein
MFGRALQQLEDRPFVPAQLRDQIGRRRGLDVELAAAADLELKTQRPEQRR